MTNRQFLHRIPVKCIEICWLLCGIWAVSISSSVAAQLDINIDYVSDAEHPSALAGVQLGLSEAQLQGGFLGQNYSLKRSHYKDYIAKKPGKSTSAIIAALSASNLIALAKTVGDRPIFNILAPDNELRKRCQTTPLHILPSSKMLEDAARQWLQKHPGAEISVRAWHRDFKKYAASQLNRRYSKQAGQPMDDSAWAGWAALRILAEAVANTGSEDPIKLRGFITGELAFDGQKGINMNFRRSGQLRQPLLIVQNGKLIGEAPVRGVVDTTDLDSLGLVRCPKCPKMKN